ncbi:MAG: hypothetical protein JXP36_20405 [Bacteroidales bacterium]|nr:hypothetical protein [Bacteroidales bacterium]
MSKIIPTFVKTLLKPSYFFLKRLVYAISFLAWVLDRRKDRINKRKEENALKLIADKGNYVFDVSWIYSAFKDQTYKTCHIIGGGWSLNKSILSIGKDDFVIGMNYSALADIDFDLYFVEQGLTEEAETKIRVEFLEKVIKKQAKTVFFKNAFGPKGIKYVLDNYGGKVNFIRSFAIHCSNDQNIIHSAQRFVKSDPVYLKQFRSTVLSSIVLAKNIGFKKIIIHGLDFGGAYFYEDQEPSDKKKKYIPPKTSLSTGKTIHQTVSKSCGVDKMIASLAVEFNKEGVKLLSATSLSPLNKILENAKNK